MNLANLIVCQYIKFNKENEFHINKLINDVVNDVQITHPKPTVKAKKALIWIDLEMTGLDTVRDEIIEIATIVTDDDLNILAEGPVLAIKVADTVLNNMDDWNKNQHGQSG